MNLLRIDCSPRMEASNSRARADIIQSAITADTSDVSVTTRDISGGLPVVTQEWIAARVTDPSDRTEAQMSSLAKSHELIAELEAHDTYLFSIPIYNFTVPASLKAWADLVALPKRTFRYTEDGPEGLLKGKRAVLVFASGGTEIGSDLDYASDYFSFFLNFIGVTDITVLGGKGDVDKDALLEAYNA